MSNSCELFFSYLILIFLISLFLLLFSYLTYFKPNFLIFLVYLPNLPFIFLSSFLIFLIFPLSNHREEFAYFLRSLDFFDISRRVPSYDVTRFAQYDLTYFKKRYIAFTAHHYTSKLYSLVRFVLQKYPTVHQRYHGNNLVTRALCVQNKEALVLPYQKAMSH